VCNTGKCNKYFHFGHFGIIIIIIVCIFCENGQYIIVLKAPYLISTEQEIPGENFGKVWRSLGLKTGTLVSGRENTIKTRHNEELIINNIIIIIIKTLFCI
jgi:hypothetical protein